MSELWRLDATAQAALVREKSVTGNRRSAADYLLAVQDLQRISRQVARFFVGYDVWLSPPAMSVPLYWNQDNVPIGVQFAARFGDEATLFRLAAQLEQARPWAERWPVL